MRESITTLYLSTAPSKFKLSGFQSPWQNSELCTGLCISKPVVGAKEIPSADWLWLGLSKSRGCVTLVHKLRWTRAHLWSWSEVKTIGHRCHALCCGGSGQILVMPSMFFTDIEPGHLLECEVSSLQTGGASFWNILLFLRKKCFWILSLWPRSPIFSWKIMWKDQLNICTVLRIFHMRETCLFWS